MNNPIIFILGTLGLIIDFILIFLVLRFFLRLFRKIFGLDKPSQFDVEFNTITIKEGLPREDKQRRKESVYKKRESVMNGSEKAFFFELQKQLPQGYFIFPKMRIADMIETKNGRGFYFKRNRILPKHVDFLVCDSYFRPKLAIELNGGSHRGNDRVESDRIKKEVFAEVDIPLEVVNVGQDFSESVNKIKANLSQ